MKRLIHLSILLGLMLSGSSFAADFRLISEGNGVYSLQGTGLQGVGGLDVTVSYDQASFGTPQVSQGAFSSGSFFASNSNLPGQIRIALVHATGLSGNGSLASISFSSASANGSAPVLKVNSLIDTKGANLAASASGTLQGANPQTGADSASGSWRDASQNITGQNQSTANSQSTAASANTSSYQAAAGAVTGTITLPQDFGKNENSRDTAKPASFEQQSTPQTVQHRESIQQHSEAPAAKKEPRSFAAPPASVLERFKSYKGERSAEAMVPLFSSRGGKWISQSPEIALSDGKSEVTIVFTPGWISGESPSFALKGVSMKKLAPEQDSSWEITATPNEGALKASIAIELEEASAAVEITLVPPLPEKVKGVKLDEKSVSDILSGAKDSKSLKWDLNGDGKRDYIDDYILVGHYILGKNSSGSIQDKKTSIKK